MDVFLSLLKDFGFPVACVIALFVMLQNEQKSHKEESEKMTEAVTELKSTFSQSLHDQESKMTEAINNNTLVIQKLLDKMEEQ